MKKAGNLDLMGLGEIQNAKLQGLSTTPETLSERLFWYDNVNHQPMFYNGSAIKKFGKEYSSGTGVTVNNSNDTIAIDTSVVALKSDITGIFNPAGNLDSASDLPTLSSSVLGNVYRVTTSFNTTSDFVEGSGKPLAVGNDVVVINVGTSAEPSYKFNVWGDFIDLSDYALSSAIPTKLSDLTDDLMTGYSKASSASAVSASDSVKAAIGKLEKALDGKQASGSYAAADHTHSGYASSSHSHVGTEVTLTGYSKASSASAVDATDTVNAAIGKLEKALDGKQASGSYASSSHTHTKSEITDFPSVVQKYTTQNIALIASNGVVTWTVTHNLGGDVQVQVFEVSTGKMIVPNDITLTSSNVATIEMLASGNVPKDTYKAVVIG